MGQIENDMNAFALKEHMKAIDTRNVLSVTVAIIRRAERRRFIIPVNCCLWKKGQRITRSKGRFMR